MFSSRTDWDFRSNRLHALVEQKRSRGEEIIDLTESNPTKCGFLLKPDLLFPADSLRASVRYDPDPKGLLTAREAVAEWYGQQGVVVDPSRIVLTSSTSEAYSFLLRLLCNVGDSIAVAKPSYPLFEYICALNDVGCRQYRLEYDGEWHIERESVYEACPSKTKALVLVHPNNPTGSFIKREERNFLLDLLRKNGLPLIVDEVFHSYAFQEIAHRNMSFAGNEETLTFTLNGLSKLAGLPQLKLGWIVVSGPAEATTHALQRLEVIADTYLSVGTAVQHSLGSLLKGAAGISGPIGARVATNYRRLGEEFSENSPVSVLHCEGGWSAVIRLPFTRTDEEWAMELLRAQGVLMHPGHLFEFDTSSCLVLSLLPDPGVFLEGLRRLTAVVTP